MTSRVNKGHKGHLEILKSSFSAIYFWFNAEYVKTFQECQHYEDANF